MKLFQKVKHFIVMLAAMVFGLNKAVENKGNKPQLLSLNLQFFGDKTLYELKQNMATVGQQLAKVENETAAKAIDTTATMEDIQNLQKSRDDLKMRFEVMKEQHDQLEKEQKAKFEANKGIQAINDPKQKKIEAKAELIRATMTSKPVPNEVFQALSDGAEPSNGGEKLLPKTMQN